jgi:hypothetical protein
MKRDDLQNLVISTSRPLLRGTPRELRRISELDTRLGQGWSSSNSEQELQRLLEMLFEWQNRGGRQVVLLCDGEDANVGYLTEVRDRMTRSQGRIAQIVVSPCDPWYEKENSNKEEMSYTLVPPHGIVANRFEFHNRARTRLGNSSIGLVRLMCCREISPKTQNETFLKKESILGVELSLVEATCSKTTSSSVPLATMLLGPILGRVTSSSIVVLVELDTVATVTCILTNKRYKLREEQSIRCPSQRPKAFVFDDLREDCLYEIQFQGVTNAKERVGCAHTLQERPRRLRVLTMGYDNIERADQDDSCAWHSLRNRLNRPRVSSSDDDVCMIVRLGGQVMTGSVYGHDTTWKAFDERVEALGLSRVVGV